MTTITADTSIMDFLGGSASSKFFGAMEEQNELTKEQLDRQKKVDDELTSMNDAISSYQEGIKTSFNQSVQSVKSAITNPINQLKADSISAYTNFTESIYDMKDGVTQKLSDVQSGFKSGINNLSDGFSSKVDNLKEGFTDAVGRTKEVMEGMSVKMEAFSNLPTEKQILLAGKTIADGVMNTVTAIPDVINSGMEKLDKGISAVGGFVKSSSGYLKGLFIKSEEADDKGGTSGLSETGKNENTSDDSSGAGIGSLLGKLMPKGLTKMFASTGKMLGKVGRFAGKLALPLMAIMGIFDFIGGVKNAEEIVGKPADQLSSMEKAGAGLSSVLSGLTFGLVDSKSIYSEGSQMIASISDFASDIFKMLPNGVQEGITKVSDIFFNPETGIFGFISKLFSKNIESIANGNWGELLLDITTAPLQALFGAEGMLANTFNHMKDGAMAVFEMLPNSFQENITSFVDTIIGWFEKIKNMASDLIPDSLKNFFGGVAESDTGKAVSSGIDSVKGFFGYGDDTKPEMAESVSQKAPVTEYGGGNPVLEAKIADNKAILAKRKMEQSTINQTSPVSEVGSEAVMIQQKRQKISNEPIRPKRTTVQNSDMATVKSKAKMNEKKDVAPVIIQQSAPAQKSGGSGKKLNTSTTIGDTELAVMNSNMMD
jgi:uncharacterized membrane-anchored protein YhcB (DUF1043 family)